MCHTRVLGKVRNKLGGGEFKSRWLCLGRINCLLSSESCIQVSPAINWPIHTVYGIIICSEHWKLPVIHPKGALISYLTRTLRRRDVQNSPSGSSRSKRNVSNGKRKAGLAQGQNFCLTVCKGIRTGTSAALCFGLSNTSAKSLTLAEKVGISSDMFHKPGSNPWRGKETATSEMERGKLGTDDQASSVHPRLVLLTQATCVSRVRKVLHRLYKWNIWCMSVSQAWPTYWALRQGGQTMFQIYHFSHHITSQYILANTVVESKLLYYYEQ